MMIKIEGTDAYTGLHVAVRLSIRKITSGDLFRAKKNSDFFSDSVTGIPVGRVRNSLLALCALHSAGY
jgi:hypothetical protein